MEWHIKPAGGQITTAYTEAVHRDRGGPEPKAPAGRMLNPEELQAELQGAIVVEELAIGDESAEGGKTAESVAVLVQPTATFNGRIPDWITDVKQAQAEG